MGCFPLDFREDNGPSRHSGKRPIKLRKRPVKEGKRPINANGGFSGTQGSARESFSKFSASGSRFGGFGKMPSLNGSRFGKRK